MVLYVATSSEFLSSCVCVCVCVQGDSDVALEHKMAEMHDIVANNFTVK